MASEKTDKILLEREYVIPLRKEWLKVPRYRRTNRAIKAIKIFIAKHMKVQDRDIRKVKINIYLNHEMWFRGIAKPPAKIKVKAKKYEDKVDVELAVVPEVLKWKIQREDKQKKQGEDAKKKAEKVKEETKEEKVEKAETKTEEEKKEEKLEEKEKKESTVEAGLKTSEKVAHEQKHVAKHGRTVIHRKALKK